MSEAVGHLQQRRAHSAVTGVNSTAERLTALTFHWMTSWEDDGGGGKRGAGGRRERRKSWRTKDILGWQGWTKVRCSLIVRDSSVYLGLNVLLPEMKTIGNLIIISYWKESDRPPSFTGCTRDLLCSSVLAINWPPQWSVTALSAIRLITQPGRTAA